MWKIFQKLLSGGRLLEPREYLMTFFYQSVAYDLYVKVSYYSLVYYLSNLYLSYHDAFVEICRHVRNMIVPLYDRWSYITFYLCFREQFGYTGRWKDDPSSDQKFVLKRTMNVPLCVQCGEYY